MPLVPHARADTDRRRVAGPFVGAAGAPADRKGPGNYRATMPPPMRMPMPRPAQRAWQGREAFIVGVIGNVVDR